MPNRPATIRHWQVVLAFVIVIVAFTLNAWNVQRVDGRDRREVKRENYALCLVAQHDHAMWAGAAQYVLNQTLANPNHTDAQLKGASDFGGYINKLNGPEVPCHR